MAADYDEPPYVHNGQGDRSAAVINVDTGRHVAAVTICAVVCGMTVILSAWAAYLADKADTEARLVEYYLMDPSARTPEELAAWSKFRTEHHK